MSRAAVRPDPEESTCAGRSFREQRENEVCEGECGGREIVSVRRLMSCTTLS
uniref:Uncharacterized protein n=1 Tax=Physcomitrium patens TaxID=3218 RepID=A0A2K1IG58_PHYPA|nr:hypothetical protein PHYPA_028847 [Physcomitrium patens]PNR28256.1 hypothetical protein PHYPA_028848 [Physcomitrium patens]PNR28258.1 hypothetical protein PHYPA_028850 [Physcomitrium patens]